MSSRAIRWLLFAALLALPLSAGADSPEAAKGAPAAAKAALATPAPKAAAAQPAQVDRPVHVRASHRVDVIAPGERVETIIDRMRASRAEAAQGEARRPEAAPARGSERSADRGQLDGTRGAGEPRGAATGDRPPGDRPPMERPHR